MKSFNQFSKNLRINESEIRFIKEEEYTLKDIVDSIKTHMEESEIYSLDVKENQDGSFDLSIEGDTYHLSMEGTNIVQKSKHSENTFKTWDELFGWWLSFVPQYKHGEAEHKLGESEVTTDDLVSDWLHHSYDSLGTPGQRGKDHPSFEKFLDEYTNEDIIKDMREYLEGDEAVKLKQLADDQLNIAIDKVKKKY